MPALDNLSRVAEVSLTVARRAGSLALSTARQVAGMVAERRRAQSRSRSSWTPPPPVSTRPASTMPRQPPPAAPASARTPAPEPAADPATPAAAPAGATPATPVTPAATAAAPDAAADHVDREAVVVAESADAGAAEGAGPQIRIGEPWKGYGSLTAKEINDRLATASPESLAIARLYEASHRNRVTVLREIDRRMKAAAGS